MLETGDGEADCVRWISARNDRQAGIIGSAVRVSVPRNGSAQLPPAAKSGAWHERLRTLDERAPIGVIPHAAGLHERSVCLNECAFLAIEAEAVERARLDYSGAIHESSRRVEAGLDAAGFSVVLLETVGTPALWIGFTLFVLALLALDPESDRLLVLSGRVSGARTIGDLVQIIRGHGEQSVASS